MRKILLSLGAVAAVVTPIATVVSCGDDDNSNEGNPSLDLLIDREKAALASLETYTHLTEKQKTEISRDISEAADIATVDKIMNMLAPETGVVKTPANTVLEKPIDTGISLSSTEKETVLRDSCLSSMKNVEVSDIESMYDIKFDDQIKAQLSIKYSQLDASYDSQTKKLSIRINAANDADDRTLVFNIIPNPIRKLVSSKDIAGISVDDTDDITSIETKLGVDLGIKIPATNTIQVIYSMYDHGLMLTEWNAAGKFVNKYYFDITSKA